MAEWQAADTAPYDTPVLAFCPDPTFGGRIEVLTRCNLLRGQGDSWCWGEEYFFQVTHWMPLPEPPK